MTTYTENPTDPLLGGGANREYDRGGMNPPKRESEYAKALANSSGDALFVPKLAVNAGGGALNVVIDTVNTAFQVIPAMHIYGFASGNGIPAIPTVGVWGGDEPLGEFYYWSSYAGSGTFIAATFATSGIAKAGAKAAANTAARAPQVIRAGELNLPGVPRGATGVPVQTGRGLAYEIPRGTPEIDPRVTGVRIMDPVTTGKYQYPNGYAAYMNEASQTVNPLTGQVAGNSDLYAHIPLP